MYVHVSISSNADIIHLGWSKTEYRVLFLDQSPAPATWKFMDSHKNHEAFIQMAKRLEQMLATMSAVARLVYVQFPRKT